jgi:hypothetical protein
MPAPLVQAVTGSARRRADTLDRLVVRPLTELIGDRELVIVPIGPLYALPWAALPSLHGRAVSIARSGDGVGGGVQQATRGPRAARRRSGRARLDR